MASDQSPASPSLYTCRCLNIRIVPAPPPSPPPHPPTDNYIPVFVKDDGIKVTHTQVTVRLNSPPTPIPGTNQFARSTALTCLFCNLSVYRVRHITLQDVQGGETTLLPSDDWVEREIMKSASGWIDVHKDCLTGDNVTKAESSHAYSPLFSLLLPSATPSSPLSPKQLDEDLLKKPVVEEQTSHLTSLKPLFLPPPFTPSNPIFAHLAEIAKRRSEELRASAEKRIEAFIAAETRGVEDQEKELKRQVELLWKDFRRHLAFLHEQERGRRTPSAARSPSRAPNAAATNGVISPPPASTSVQIRNFIPTPVTSTLHTPSASLPRVSALSASLATSSFHHPREKQRRGSAGATSFASTQSDSSTTLSTQSNSSTLVHPIQADNTNVFQFKRNINDNINTEASYRYFVNLDEDMQRYKKQQEALASVQQNNIKEQTSQAGPSMPKATTSTNGTKRDQATQPQSPSKQPLRQEEDTTPSRGRDKGKRKVTFDVQPAVVRIGEDEREEAVQEDPREVIFVLDDLESGEGVADPSQGTLPLLEQPAPRPQRPKKTRPNAISGGDVFSSLRPSSLPAPSHIRPMRSQPGVDSSSQGMMLSMPKAAPVNSATTPRAAAPASPLPLNEQDEQLLKLVAADTPSHRGAWAPDSKAWQTFTRRPDHKDESDGDDEEIQHPVVQVEGTPTPILVNVNKPNGKQAIVADLNNGDDEEDDDVPSSALRAAVPGSLPISIKPRVKPRQPLSLASYRPPTTIPEATDPPAEPPTSPNGVKPSSSLAIRKAVYAERDRVRSMDPGPLDFSADEAGSESDESDEEIAKSVDASGRSLMQARKILQARSELPEEGMWRSLA